MSTPNTTDRAARLDLDFERDPGVLSLLAADLGLGVFTVDAGGRFVAWSRGAEAITGHPRVDVVGAPCQMLDGPQCKGFSGLAALLAARSPETDTIENQECEILGQDGSPVRLLGSARLLRDAAGQVYGALGVIADLTRVLRLNAPADVDAEAESCGELIGRSSAMKEIFRKIRLAAASDVTTLITGESGTGKELCARAIHDASERASGSFIAVNCSALPETLLESELFGHVKGAFTGASRDHRGLIEAADGGTLFLDEIGEISPLIQVKLLRVLQERQIQRVGDESAISVDVRLLTATHRDLRDGIAQGRIREDFFYRVHVFEIPMPPLRERASDIPLLAMHFAESISREHGALFDGIAQDALQTLLRHPWPGNARELHNAIEHALVVASGPTIGLLDLPDSVRSAGAGRTLAPGELTLSPKEEAEKLAILDALDANDWNRTKSAAALGVSRVTLWKRIRRYHIDEGLFGRGPKDGAAGDRTSRGKPRSSE